MTRPGKPLSELLIVIVSLLPLIYVKRMPVSSACRDFFSWAVRLIVLGSVFSFRTLLFWHYIAWRACIRPGTEIALSARIVTSHKRSACEICSLKIMKNMPVSMDSMQCCRFGLQCWQTLLPRTLTPILSMRDAIHQVLTCSSTSS